MRPWARSRIDSTRRSFWTFDFLGTGVSDWGSTIRWNRDVNSGYSWPANFYTDLDIRDVYGTGVDVKIPWELSRFHHAVVLAQAHCLSEGDGYADELAEQWGSWREANPFPYGVNWISAMEASIRAVNVLYSAALISSDANGERRSLDSLSTSMREHGTFIERNLEVGAGPEGLVTGNHYLANLCGLACIGLALPDLPESGRWRRAGLSGLESEARRQVLPDGFFWEGSTSYHRLVLELLLVPALIARRTGVDLGIGYWATLERMCEVVMRLIGPAGGVPIIGDNDDGRLLITSGYPGWRRSDHRYLLAIGAALFSRPDMKGAAGPAHPDLFWLLGEDGVRDFEALPSKPSSVPSQAFVDGGLCVLRGDRDGDFAVLRSGGAVHGAPTGHLHNDALSLELWLDGEAVTVDPGTLAYTSDSVARDELRSTLAHATVSLNGGEQNCMVPGSPFELGIETDVELLECRTNETTSVATVRAYWRGGGTHVRRVAHDRHTGDWRVEDTVTGADRATWSWPLAPGRAALGARVEANFPWAESVQQGRMAPSYGVEAPIRIIRHEGTLHGEGRAIFTFQVPHKATDRSTTGGSKVGARE